MVTRKAQGAERPDFFYKKLSVMLGEKLTTLFSRKLYFFFLNTNPSRNSTYEISTRTTAMRIHEFQTIRVCNSINIFFQ